MNATTVSSSTASVDREPKQKSALKRLKELPAVFSGKDLTIRFQWTSKTASQYLYLWGKRGLVKPLGGHSDTFANLLVQPQPDWERALRVAMPSAVIIGVDALRRQGWTTQVMPRPEVAVDVTMPIYKVDHFVVVPRTPAWFATSRKGVEDGCLQPAWALADMLSRQEWGAFGLYPDDIDWGAITDRDRRQWVTASKAFGLAPVGLDDVAHAEVKVEDQRQKTPRPRS